MQVRPNSKAWIPCGIWPEGGELCWWLNLPLCLGLGLCPVDSSTISISKDLIVYWSVYFMRCMVQLTLRARLLWLLLQENEAGESQV